MGSWICDLGMQKPSLASKNLGAIISILLLSKPQKWLRLLRKRRQRAQARPEPWEMLMEATEAKEERIWEGSSPDCIECANTTGIDRYSTVVCAVSFIDVCGKTSFSSDENRSQIYGAENVKKRKREFSWNMDGKRRLLEEEVVPGGGKWFCL